MRLCAWLTTVAAVLLPCGLAQKPPAGPAGSAPGSSAGRTPTTTETNPSTSSLNRQIYISGKVMLDDGTPPPEPVRIERVCGGTPRALAFTDQRGQFAFQFGHTEDVMQDASEDEANAGGQRRPPGLVTSQGSQAAYNTPDTQLSNCDLRAVLAGFRSDVITLGARRLLDDPNIGTIMLHRLSHGQGVSVSVTTLEAPKDARKAYDKGLRLAGQERFADAQKQFQKAVDLDPKFAAAWYELGKLEQRNQETGRARDSYTKALAADSKFMGPYEQLSKMAADASDWHELADTTARLLELDPDGHPTAYFLNAAANLNLNRIEAAEKSAWAGVRLDPRHEFPKREQLLATILARKKDYAGAAERMRLYLEYAPEADDAARMRVQLAEYERLSGGGRQQEAAKPGPR